MAEIGKLVSNQVQVGRYVAVSAEVHAQSIAAGLRGLGERLGVEVPDGLEEAIRFLGKLPAVQSDLLLRAETDLLDERSDDAAVLAERDAAAARVSATVRAIRNAIGSMGGAVDQSTYRVAAPPPDKPSRLADYGAAGAEAMIKYPKVFKGPAGLSLDTKAAGKELGATVVELRTHLGTVSTEARELESALGARDVQSESWRVVYRGTASALEGLYVLAGHENLADRVRPTEQRVRGDLTEQEQMTLDPTTVQLETSETPEATQPTA